MFHVKGWGKEKQKASLLLFSLVKHRLILPRFDRSFGSERGESTERSEKKRRGRGERENTCYSPPSPFPCERTITKSPLSSFLLPFLPSTDWAVNPGEPFSDRRKTPFLSRCSSKNIILVNSAFLGTDEGIICAAYLTVFLYGVSTFY